MINKNNTEINSVFHVLTTVNPLFARVLSPLFFQAKSLLLPKPGGKREHSKATWS